MYQIDWELCQHKRSCLEMEMFAMYKLQTVSYNMFKIKSIQGEKPGAQAEGPRLHLLLTPKSIVSSLGLYFLFHCSAKRNIWPKYRIQEW